MKAALRPSPFFSPSPSNADLHATQLCRRVYVAIYTNCSLLRKLTDTERVHWSHSAETITPSKSPVNKENHPHSRVSCAKTPYSPYDRDALSDRKDLPCESRSSHDPPDATLSLPNRLATARLRIDHPASPGPQIRRLSRSAL